MRKVILFQKRREGSERKSYFQWALDGQLRLVRDMPGLRGCVVSLEAEGKEETFDIATELRFDDAKAVASALTEDVLASVRSHSSRLERVDLVEHELVRTGDPAPFKLMAALKRREDLSRSDFKTWWLDKHAPYVIAFPELRRYQVNLVEDGPEWLVDGVAEVCFVDLGALQRIMSRGDVKEVQQDSQVHTRARYRMFVEEHPVL